jgi:hypothetical protein
MDTGWYFPLRFRTLRKDVLLSSGQRELAGQAEQGFRTALSIDSHYADAEINPGTLDGKQGNDGEWKRLFHEALTSDPALTKPLPIWAPLSPVNRVLPKRTP